MRPLLDAYRTKLGGPATGAILGLAALAATVISLLWSRTGGAIVGVVGISLVALTAISAFRARDLYRRSMRIRHVTFEWDIQDAVTTTYRKRLDVEFLHSDVISLWDDAWTEGTFTSFTCDPGRLVDSFRVGGQHYRLVSLRQRRNRGERESFLFEWTIENGFVGDDQYVEVAILPWMDEALVKVRFPRGTEPTKPMVNKRSDEGEWKALAGDVLTRDGDRTLLTWRPPRGRRSERYAIKWDW